MAAAPSSPRKDRIAALLVLAETIVCRTDDEKGHIAWTGRSKMLEVITLLDSVDRSEQELRLSNTAPSASQVTGGMHLANVKFVLPYLGWRRRGRHLTH